MAKFTVNVHYDYVATVEVEAENEEQALELAKDVADELSTQELELCGLYRCLYFRVIIYFKNG